MKKTIIFLISVIGLAALSAFAFWLLYEILTFNPILEGTSFFYTLPSIFAFGLILLHYFFLGNSNPYFSGFIFSISALYLMASLYMVTFGNVYGFCDPDYIIGKWDNPIIIGFMVASLYFFYKVFQRFSREIKIISFASFIIAAIDVFFYSISFDILAANNLIFQ